MKKCPNCKAANENKDTYCAVCGTKLGNKTRSKKTILIVSIVIVYLLLSGLIFARYFVWPKMLEEKNKLSEISTIQANEWNWGFATEVNDVIVYSDICTGMYVHGEYGDDLFADGVYTDLFYHNNYIYCVENIWTDVGEQRSLVKFNYSTREKTLIYSSQDAEAIITLYNVFNDKLYFIVDERLYYLDSTDSVTDTGIDNVIKVTNSGIFTKSSPDLSLQLNTFDNTLVGNFDIAGFSDINMIFEKDGFAYIELLNEDWTIREYARVNLENGEFESLGKLSETAAYCGINIKNNNIYYSLCDYETFTIYKADLDFGNKKVLYTSDFEGGNPLILLSIIDDTICAVSPYSQMGAKFLNIDGTSNDYMPSETMDEVVADDYSGYIEADEGYTNEGSSVVQTQQGQEVQEYYEPPVKEEYYEPVVDVVQTIYSDSFSGDITEDSQVDKYKYTAPYTGTYNFTFDLSYVGVYMTFAIYDEKGDCIESTSFDDGDNVSVKLEASRTYEINIRQKSNYAQYNISIGIPNPTQTVSGTSFSGSIDYIDQCDVFTYTAAITGMHNFSFSLSDVNMSGRFAIYNRKNACLESCNLSDEESVSVQLDAGESYTINISHKYGFASYSVNISLPNAPKSVTGNLISGNLTYPKQEDKYSYVAPVTGKYNFSFENTDTLSCSIYDEKNSSILSGKYRDTDKTAMLEAGKTYEIVVRYVYATDYNITISVPQSVQNISGNRVSGTFNFKEQVDNYTYTAPISGTYGLSFEGDGYYKCYFITQDDDWILADSFSSGSTANVDLEAGQTYNVQITEKSSEEYDITIHTPLPIQTVSGGTISGTITYEGQKNRYYFTPGYSGEYEFTFECPDFRAKFAVMLNDDYVEYEKVREGKSMIATLESGVTYILQFEQDMYTGDYSFTIN